MDAIRFVRHRFKNGTRLISAFLLLLTTTSIQDGKLCAAERSTHLKSLAVTTDQGQAEYIRRNFAIFQIVDPHYSNDVLEQAVDFNEFRLGVSAWIENNGLRWEQVQSYLDYCRNEEAKGRIGTTIDADGADVRWRLFLMNGPPIKQLTLPCKCESGRASCTLWTYAWPPDSTNLNGKEISCQSLRGEAYPTMVTRSGAESFPEARPLWPLVQCSRFPIDDGGYELWFSIWVLGNELSRTTLNLAELHMQVVLLDSTQRNLIGKAQCTANLQLLRGILEATNVEDRDLIKAMGYLGLSGVSAGTFYARVTVNGAPYNEGDETFKIEVPQRSKMSDLLLIEKSAVDNENTQAGIIRGTRSDLYDNPEGIFRPGSKLNLYAEADLPSRNQEEYEVQVSLLKISDYQQPRKEIVKLTDAVVVADSLDRPFADGAFGSADEGVLMSSTGKGQSSRGNVNLLTKTFRNSGGRAIVNVMPELKSNMSSGRYMLTLTITDPKSRSYYLRASRVIQIASRTTNF